MQEIVESARVGVVVPNMQANTVRGGVDELVTLLDDPEVRSRCVSAARHHFSLEQGVSAYDRIYRSLAR